METMVQGQPRQKVHETPSHPMTGCGAHLSPHLCRETQIGSDRPGHKVRPYHKNNQSDRPEFKPLYCQKKKKKDYFSSPQRKGTKN
jgi:hypothetical protein